MSALSRRIITSINMTLDGIVSGPEGDPDDLGWVTPNLADATAGVDDLLDAVDTVLLGRVTYQGFVEYWPTATGEFADKFNGTPKVVLSDGGSGLTGDEWGDRGNVTMIEADAIGGLTRLKARPGRDIVTFGSPTLVARLTDAGLIDQYRLIVHPVVLGSGRRLFEGIAAPRPMRLVQATPYSAGAVEMTYEPV